jgi:tetratricopeptide (TPR) repeat protein
LAAFLVVAGVLAIVLAIRRRRENTEGGTAIRATSVLISAALVLVSFLVVAYPYLSDNKARFGRYFYNVNSRFFMWCDSWAEGKAFADAHRITEHYPTAGVEEIPGPVNYWQTHTGGQILRRLGAGFTALGSLALSGTYFKYLAFTVAICIGLGVKELRRIRGLPAEDWGVVALCALLPGGYLLAFAWYAQVAYGDRFLLSLFLPIMFAALWLSARLSASARPFSLFGIRVRTGDVLAGALAMLLVGEGSARAITSGNRPTPAFVSFYYNESQELLHAGNPREAEKGFAGVVQLDPTFAPAHHALGMIAMAEQRFEEAVTHLVEVVRLEPRAADGHNSLGSALVQAGRLEEAVAAFSEAVRLDPGLAVAWYNLGGTYCRLGELEEAKAIRKRLQQLSPDLARRLDSLIGE